MYEYGPPDGKKNPLEKGKGDDYKYVPLKEQLAGLTSRKEGAVPPAQASEPLKQTSPDSHTPKEVSQKPHTPRTGVLEQAMSPNLALTTSGLIIVFTTVVTNYFSIDERINTLIVLGSVFLIAALISLIGSHIMVKKKDKLSFFRAINGVTVGTGMGFVFSTILFFLQIYLT